MMNKKEFKLSGWNNVNNIKKINILKKKFEDPKMVTAINIILEMLKQRNYNLYNIILKDNLIYGTYQDYITSEACPVGAARRPMPGARDPEDRSLQKKSCKFVVFLDYIEKFGVDQIKYYTAKLKELKISHCIIIYYKNITSMAKKNIEKNHEKIELFHIDKLQYNITKHRLVPKHEKLSNYEAQLFKKKIGIQIPIMLKKDPICKFYNFNKGNIIKITRSDNFVSYRIIKK